MRCESFWATGFERIHPLRPGWQCGHGRRVGQAGDGADGPLAAVGAGLQPVVAEHPGGHAAGLGRAAQRAVLVVGRVGGTRRAATGAHPFRVPSAASRGGLRRPSRDEGHARRQMVFRRERRRRGRPGRQEQGVRPIKPLQAIPDVGESDALFIEHGIGASRPVIFDG